MSRLDDLIKKLPVEYREMARRYLPIFIDSTFDEIEQWAALIAIGNWRDAYELVVRKMSTEVLLDEQGKCNERLRKLNKENADYIQLQQEIIRKALLIGLLALKKEIE